MEEKPKRFRGLRLVRFESPSRPNRSIPAMFGGNAGREIYGSAAVHVRTRWACVVLTRYALSEPMGGHVCNVMSTEMYQMVR